MRVLLVRHGHAGTKRNWNGDDRLRPLDPPGVAESEALAVRLIPFGPTRIISSPYQRCVESVTPLSAVCARPIERSEALGPEGGEGAKNLVLDLAANGAGTFVVCTHGEVIHYLQTHLGSDGPPTFGEQSPREKASVWILDGTGGRFINATYLPPPLPAG